jgi:hypothetical protein
LQLLLIAQLPKLDQRGSYEYLVPGPYETGFISMAHTKGDINDYIDVIGKVVAKWWGQSPDQSPTSGSANPCAIALVFRDFEQ